MSKIVVGVDGSEGATEALRWALAEARLRGARVEVIHAWNVPLILTLPSPDSFGIPEPAGSMEEMRAALRKEGESVLQASLMASDRDGVAVETELAEGKPSRVFIHAAEDADLLVLGMRGLGGFAGLLLGSVSHQCTHHAPCPVVIVPSRRDI